jgi:indole-3-glycerol phosphate synthase
MSDVLERICAAKRLDVEDRRQALPMAELERRLALASPVRGFRHALEATIAEGRFALIAEIKKASPSKGLIRADFMPRSCAWPMPGGATFSRGDGQAEFQGDDAFSPRPGCRPLPALRKIFCSAPYQS